MSAETTGRGRGRKNIGGGGGGDSMEDRAERTGPVNAAHMYWSLTSDRSLVPSHRRVGLNTTAWLGCPRAKVTLCVLRPSQSNVHTPSIAFLRHLPPRKDVVIKPLPGVWVMSSLLLQSSLKCFDPLSLCLCVSLSVSLPLSLLLLLPLRFCEVCNFSPVWSASILSLLFLLRFSPVKSAVFSSSPI